MLTSGWVVTEKMIGEEKGCKARLVVHGNQDNAEVDVDSPTVQKSSLRLQMTIAAQYGWRLKTCDVTSAFLQSDNLDRNIYVVPPKEANEGENVWKLIKPMYGLPESSRKWYFIISQHGAATSALEHTAVNGKFLIDS